VGGDGAGGGGAEVSHATALAGRLVVRNGLRRRWSTPAVGTAIYAPVTMAWAVEADDRYEVLRGGAGADRGEPTGLGRCST